MASIAHRAARFITPTATSSSRAVLGRSLCVTPKVSRSVRVPRVASNACSGMLSSRRYMADFAKAPRAEKRPDDLPTAFRTVPRTGVIFASSEAAKMGYSSEDPTWCNMGQGMPEVGPLPGSAPSVDKIEVDLSDTQYAPVGGIWELREAVAHLYNELYRKGKESQYTAENVAICGGGRVALTRVAAALGRVNIGHFLPDYSAYEELLDIFGNFKTIPILLEAERGWSLTPAEIRKEVVARGLAAILFSNPANPTGKIVAGENMREWVKMARELDCTLISDEFFSHYIWRPDLRVAGGYGGFFSSASYIDDVNKDPVVIVNGMTKNWRLPGWRLCWNIGPKSIIQCVSASGSFLDGGGSRPLQRAAVDLVTPENTRRETIAISETFRKKREAMLNGLRDMGLTIEIPPEGTFYIWAGIHNLPKSINDGVRFFRTALKYKVIVVPGEFFDVNPGRRRPCRFKQYLRFSFGPEMATCEEALTRLKQMITDERMKEAQGALDGVHDDHSEHHSEDTDDAVDPKARAAAAVEFK